jgi:hypothetical protein
MADPRVRNNGLDLLVTFFHGDDEGQEIAATGKQALEIAAACWRSVTSSVATSASCFQSRAVVQF